MMRSLLAIALACLLWLPVVAAQTAASTPTTRGPEGAADDRGAFNPVWIFLVGIGFVSLVFVGLLWRRRQRPGNR